MSLTGVGNKAVVTTSPYFPSKTPWLSRIITCHKCSQCNQTWWGCHNTEEWTRTLTWEELGCPCSRWWCPNTLTPEWWWTQGWCKQDQWWWCRACRLLTIPTNRIILLITTNRRMMTTCELKYEKYFTFVKKCYHSPNTY